MLGGTMVMDRRNEGFEDKKQREDRQSWIKQLKYF